MKVQKNIFMRSVHCLWAVLLLWSFSACSDDDGISIYRVYTNMIGVPVEEITSAYTGQWIHVEGKGFSGLQAIYCNGYRAEFKDILIDDEHVVFQIPGKTPMAYEVEDESLRNTLTFVSANGTATCQFVFKDRNRMPGITGVSHTLPVPGETIYLIGNNLNNITEVYFPAVGGEIQAVDFRQIDTKKISVVVPAGVGDVSGSIRIVSSEGDSFYSPDYMFYRKGIFLSTFSEEERKDERVTGDALSQPNMKMFTKESPSISAADNSDNPENFVAFPAEPANVPAADSKDTSVGFCKFSLRKGLEAAIANSEGDFTLDTKLSRLALQVDVYMSIPWTSGLVSLRLDKNKSGADSAESKSLALWSTGVPYDFAGNWSTITISFADFNGMKAQILGELIASLNKTNYSLLGFFNFDLNGDHPASAMSGFQINMANMRLVPCVVPGE
ncbi:glycan-binding surface protein [Bacteroides ovatus]|uniref:glycan-binding surface protein n=1 Tax=Bacteroides ovatus TaxID=28116 RepID=UPI0012ABA72F|nr:glycan-binding surface protein [Bacteroides ovatus]